MTEKERLRELVIIINEFLSSYIKVHNKIHKESETFLSVIKNFFGIGIPMSQLLVYAKSLIPQSESVKEKLVFFNSNLYIKLTTEEKYYFDLLSNYFYTLEKTVNYLVKKQILMDLYGNNSLDKISFKEMQKTNNEYKSSINDYLEIGIQLNNASHIVFKNL